MLLLLALAVGCRSREVATQPKTVVESAAQPGVQAQTETAEEKSCREFVQGFYDWYFNGHLSDDDKRPAWFDVAKQRPYLLSDRLRTLLNRESAEEDRTKEIGALDFDPFLAAQDWSEAYKTRGAKIEGDHCEVQVTGSPDLRKIELAKVNSTWVFTDFDYSSYAVDGKTKDSRDYDLVKLLANAQAPETKAKRRPVRK